MKTIIISILILSFLPVSILDAQPWSDQPDLALDNNKNITNHDDRRQIIFPVMLYSFIGETENDSRPLPKSHFWYQASQWGFNIIHTWADDQNNTFQSANQFKIITNLRKKTSGGYSRIYNLHDEPIAWGKTLKDLESRIAGFSDSKPNHFLRFVNFSVRPYYYRLKHYYDESTDPSIIFASKEKHVLRSRGRDIISTVSYDAVVDLIDIISFDFYPFSRHGDLTNEPYTDTKTTVGEFTRLLKNQYPDKAVWVVIQTLPYWSYANPKVGDQYITEEIIRHLTFSAIINGADGISFYGQDQYDDSSHGRDPTITPEETITWYITLRQTVELKKLQTNFDKILLYDNINGYPVKNQFIEYSFKIAKNSSKYYLFATNLTNQNISAKIDIIQGSRLASSITAIGEYYIPAESRTKDYRNPNALGAVSADGTYFDSHFVPYGVNIFSFELEELP